MDCVHSNYEVIMFVWDEALDVVPDSKTCARIAGIQEIISTFKCSLCLTLATKLLAHTGSLSKKNC